MEYLCCSKVIQRGIEQHAFHLQTKQSSNYETPHEHSKYFHFIVTSHLSVFFSIRRIPHHLLNLISSRQLSKNRIIDRLPRRPRARRVLPRDQSPSPRNDNMFRPIRLRLAVFASTVRVQAVLEHEWHDGG